MSDLTGLSPLEWNERVKAGTLRDGYGALVPLWQVWRADCLLDEYKAEYGDELSVAKMALLRRAITLQVICEFSDALYLAGKGIDSVAYNQNVSGMRRILIDLGLEKKVTATSALSEHIKNKKAKVVLATSNGAPVLGPVIPPWLRDELNKPAPPASGAQ